MAETEDTPEPAGPGQGDTRAPFRRKPPVTIDLAATSIDPDETTPEEPAPDDFPIESEPRFDEPADFAPPPERPAPADQSSWQAGMVVPLVIAAVIGGVATLALERGFEATGIFRHPASEESVGQLAQEVAALKSSAATTGAVNTATTRIGTVDAALKTLAANTDDLRRRIETAPAPASAERLDQLAAEITELRGNIAGLNSAAGTGVDFGARLDELAKHVDSLTAQLARWAENPPTDRRTETTARALAFAGLRAHADAGEPFADDLAMLKSLAVTTPPALDAAKLGVPSRPVLIERFDATADAILAASATAAADTGFLNRLAHRAGSLVSIRPAGPVAGTTPEAIVSRMRAAVEKGDLAAALTERNALPDAAKAASAEWANDAARRVALDEAVTDLTKSIGLEAAAGN